MFNLDMLCYAGLWYVARVKHIISMSSPQRLAKWQHIPTNTQGIQTPTPSVTNLRAFP